MIAKKGTFAYNSLAKPCKISSLLVLFIFVAACSRQDKTAFPKESPNDTNTATATPSDNNLPPEDPSFVLSKDTISTHGPRSITRNVLLDRAGNIWLATWEGIVRYDGKYFTNVTLKNGLRHYHVFSILEDAAGNLWFGTIRGGVYRYDGTSFTLFTTKDGLASNLVECMLQDDAGNIWFGTDKGASRYDGTTFTNFNTQDSPSAGFVYTMLQDKTGIIWFGTDGGVIQYNGQSFTHFANAANNPPFYRVQSIIEDKTRNIWIGSADGLCRYDPSASGEKSLTNFPNASSTVFEDKAGNLWLSGSKANVPGMTLTKYDGKSFAKIITKTQVFGIAEDRGGNIWFGTENGVCRYDPMKSFESF